MSAESANASSGVVPVTSDGEGAIYTCAGMEAELRQGEIITNLQTYFYDPADESVTVDSHPFALLVSQDCDVLRDFENLTEDSSFLGSNLVFIESSPAISARAQVPEGRDIWKRIIQNKDERYHALECVVPSADMKSEGVPDLIVDFRRWFTLNSKEVYRQIREGVSFRRARLTSPYREHFQNRAAFYFQRIMLPVDHKITPPPKA